MNTCTAGKRPCMAYDLPCTASDPSGKCRVWFFGSIDGVTLSVTILLKQETTFSAQVVEDPPF